MNNWLYSMRFFHVTKNYGNLETVVWRIHYRWDVAELTQDWRDVIGV